MGHNIAAVSSGVVFSALLLWLSLVNCVSYSAGLRVRRKPDRALLGDPSRHVTPHHGLMVSTD